MVPSASLFLDGYLSTLLRHLAEEVNAADGIALIQPGVIAACYRRVDHAPPHDFPQRLLDQALSGGLISGGGYLCVPVTAGGTPLAALCFFRADQEDLEPARLRSLLEHGAQGSIAWPALHYIQEPEEDPLPPLHVLVVEDNAVNRKVAQAFLEHAGHAVHTCSDGAQAVAEVQNGDFDVVLMDIRMPGMDGVEATRLIRSLPDRRRASMPILAVTANFTHDEVESYMAAGINAIIHKPIRLGDLEEALAPFFKTAPSVNDNQQTPFAAAPAVPAERQAPLLDQTRIGLLRDAIAPETLEDLFLTAAASIRDILPDLERHWRDGAIDQVGKCAHRLAGVAANFGCQALGELAQTVEQASKAGRDSRAEADRLLHLALASAQALEGL